MTETNRRKRKISITVSQRLVLKMDSLIKNGKFASTSDIINISIAEILGKISMINQNSFFDFSSLEKIENNDDSKKENISITVSEYLNDELEILSEVTKKPKSHLIRLSLIDFFKKYNTPRAELNTIQPEMPKTREELENFIIETIEKVDRK